MSRLPLAYRYSLTTCWTALVFDRYAEENARALSRPRIDQEYPMAKLADAIRRSQRIESAPMGFGAARVAPKATMLVGAIVSNAAGVAKAREAGADLVVAKDDQSLVSGVTDIPAGAWTSTSV